MDMSPETAELQQEDSASIGMIGVPGPLTLPALASAPALPDYLVRHYAWAYLWPVSIWFFDHQPIINAILFGNYRRIMNETLRLMDLDRAGRTLQIAGVYGELTPSLAKKIDDLHLVDVAPGQLRAAERKLNAIGRKAHMALMNCESLTYGDASFDTVLLFLLLHELPPDVRRRTLSQAIRVTRPGGHLVMSEYGEFGRRHVLHRFPLFRWILEFAEPFLGGFWREDLVSVMRDCGKDVGRTVELDVKTDIFWGFYRVMRFKVS